MYPGRARGDAGPAGASDWGAGRAAAGRAGGRSLYFAAVNAEFNWWLLIVGLVVGAGLVWLVVLDSRRREADLDAVERPREAAWLSAVLVDEGWDVPPAAAERLLDLHRRYLEAPPPDEVTAVEIADPDLPPATEATEATTDVPTGDDEPSELSGDDRVGVERGSRDLGQ